MTTINDRKLEHINIVLEKDVYPYPSVFEKYRLPYQALPELDLEAVDTSYEFLGKKLSFPFVISSMTWWPDKGKLINTNLASAAEKAGVALWLWSMRVMLRKPESIDSFNVRKICPSIPLCANMGLVQLNYGYGADEINRIIELVQADAIFLHINALQEAIQPEWDTNFSHLIEKLATILPQINAPVIVKECGNGIDYRTAQRLRDIGVEWIDVSGLWGTSRPAVEWYRRSDTLARAVQKLGIATDEALKSCQTIQWLQLIAWWGLRSGIDVAKARLLGAKLWTAAQPFLKPALMSEEAVYETLMLRKREYQIALRSMWSDSNNALMERNLITL